MKKTLIITALMMLSAFVTAQDAMKVALLETRLGDGSTTASGMEKAMVRGELRKAIAKEEGYEAFTRTDIDQIMSEQGFQRTGMVSEEQIKQLGEMSGADYICISTLTKSNEEFYLEAYLINVETAQISNPASQYGELTGGKLANMFPVCQALAQELIGAIQPNSNQKINTSSNPVSRPQSQSGNVITIKVGNVSFDMIRVEAGSFTMGCTSEQGGDCYNDESPYHRVTISQDYYIGKFEVTQELWEAVMGTNPSNWKAFDRPVENVSWNDAQEFCAELNRMTGRRFRLPTEAEWEYAARGGKKSTNAKYSGSSSVANVAWYNDNSGSQTHPVGKLRPNELGIYDMSGNVWEWCQDWYGNYSSASQTDPLGASSDSSRVLRGGSWVNIAGSCRVSLRYFDGPANRFSNYGFRLVLPQ